MKKLELHIKRQTIIQGLLFIAAIVITALCLPHESKFRYSYQENKPWEYPLLTAPFDIPIELSPEEVEIIQDSITNNFKSIYKTVKSVSASNLKAMVMNNSNKISSSEIRFYAEILDKVYTDGIVDNDTYSKIANGSMKYLQQVNDEHAIENVTTARFRSVRTAYEYIDSMATKRSIASSPASLKINQYLEPNIVVDNDRSQKLLKSRLLTALAPTGMIQKGERIVDRGDVVTPQIANIIDNLYKEYEDNPQLNTETLINTISKVVIITIIFVMLYLFLAVFRRNIFYDIRKLTFVMSLVTCFSAIFYICVGLDPVKAAYIMPFAIVPIVMATFFDSGSAVVVHIVEVMVASIVSTYSTDLVLMQFVVGIVAIASMQEMTRRSQLARCAGIVMACYCIIYVAFFVMEKGTFNGLSKYVFLYFLINGIFLSFSNLLIYMLEKIFGFTSSVTLVELTDINQPALRQLSEQCPGTFQHAMQVSNLSAEAAHRIGANVQLVRVGALYHDIGKVTSPNFFTENQRGVNPHMSLTPKQSASIVIRHISAGLELAEKHNLPQAVRDFISQHHGSGVARYFYMQECMNNPDTKVDPEPFTYPGPNPQTRETALVMMADATEAAAKSLSDHSHDSISALVNKIIDGQIQSGLLKDAPISFRDVEIIKNTFIERLDAFYHVRIKYPDQVKPKATEETQVVEPSEPTATT